MTGRAHLSRDPRARINWRPPSPFMVVLAKETARQLRHRLSDDTYQVVKAFLDGQNTEEIARTLDITTAEIFRRLDNAREELSEAFVDLLAARDMETAS